MASKDDQMLALLVDIRNRLVNLETHVRRVEESVQGTRNDVVTAGHWTKQILDRR